MKKKCLENVASIAFSRDAFVAHWFLSFPSLLLGVAESPPQLLLPPAVHIAEGSDQFDYVSSSHRTTRTFPQKAMPNLVPPGIQMQLGWTVSEEIVSFEKSYQDLKLRR
jgi:hypothetical protein